MSVILITLVVFELPLSLHTPCNYCPRENTMATWLLPILSILTNLSTKCTDMAVSGLEGIIMLNDEAIALPMTVHSINNVSST